MYTPAHFNESRLPALHAFMGDYPLAAVITQASGRLDANHIPLMLDPAIGPFGILRGHIARANSMWREAEPGPEVLVVFQGPGSYVSPGFYPSKKEHGRVVPTWNYGVVHARGTLKWVHDPEWLRALVEQLTDQHEAGRPEAWRVSDAPDDYVTRMLGAIVGFEIAIHELSGKLKLSQNRSEADREGVRSGLGKGGSASSVATAELMDQRDTGSAR